MTDGTTMQSKLNAVFATDTELSTAIENLRKEIPTELGVMSLSASGDAEITLAVDKSTGEIALTGSHAAHAAGSAKTASTASIVGHSATGEIKIPKIVTNAAGHITEISEETVTITLPDAPEAVTLPSVEDNAVAFSFVTEVDQAAGAVSNNKAKLVQGANITLTQDTAGGDITIAGKDWSGEIAAVDTGVMSVSGENAISVSGDAEVKVSLVLDNSGNVTLSQGENGLKAEITAADLGLSNAMHFIGAFTEAPADPKAGDVYLNTATHKEYVYDETNGWVELGDEGSHALKTITITGVDGLTGGGTLEANREIKLSDASIESLRKADNSKQKQDTYTAEGSTVKTVTKVEQNANGEVTITYSDIAFPQAPDYTDAFAGKKDVQEAVENKITDKAHVLTSLTQNANGDISYSVKALTPEDIGAQPAGNYKTKQTATIE
jgi:hypothetical protein